MEDPNTSKVKKFLQAMEYKRLSKLTFKVVVVGYNQNVWLVSNFLTESV